MGTPPTSCPLVRYDKQRVRSLRVHPQLVFSRFTLQALPFRIRVQPRTPALVRTHTLSSCDALP